MFNIKKILLSFLLFFNFLYADVEETIMYSGQNFNLAVGNYHFKTNDLQDTIYLNIVGTAHIYFYNDNVEVEKHISATGSRTVNIVRYPPNSIGRMFISYIANNGNITISGTSILDQTAPPELCEDNNIPLIDDSYEFGWTCDRTCESINLITDSNGQCVEAGLTCTDDILPFCESQCNTLGIFNYECYSPLDISQDSSLIDCTCNPDNTEVPPTDSNNDDSINSASDINNSEEHILAENGDAYNTYNYTKTETNTIDLSELVSLNSNLETLTNEAKTSLNTIKDTSSDIKSNTNDIKNNTNDIKNNINTSNTLLEDIKENTANANTKLANLSNTITSFFDSNTTDFNTTDIDSSIIDTNSSDGLLSTYIQTYNNLQSDLNNTLNSINTLKETVSNPLELTEISKGTINSCPYTQYLDLNMGTVYEISFDLCELASPYHNTFYTISYILFMILILRFAFSVIRGIL